MLNRLRNLVGSKIAAEFCEAGRKPRYRPISWLARGRSGRSESS
jgi:hypothetical protein